MLRAELSFDDILERFHIAQVLNVILHLIRVGYRSTQHRLIYLCELFLL